MKINIREGYSKPSFPNLTVVPRVGEFLHTADDFFFKVVAVVYTADGNVDVFVTYASRNKLGFKVGGK